MIRTLEEADGRLWTDGAKSFIRFVFELILRILRNIFYRAPLLCRNVLVGIFCRNIGLYWGNKNEGCTVP